MIIHYGMFGFGIANMSCHGVIVGNAQIIIRLWGCFVCLE